MPGGEDLGDRPAGVVGDEIDAGEPERVAEVLKDGRQRGQGQVLPVGHRAASVQRQVEGDAAPLPREAADDVPPEVGVGRDAVDEQGGRAGPDVDVADLARAGRDAAPGCVKFLQLHYDRLPSECVSLVRPTVGL